VYLRSENEDDEARCRKAEVDRRIEELKRSLVSDSLPAASRNALDLAAIYCWRGQSRLTLDVLQSIVDSNAPQSLQFEARHMIADNHFRHDQYDLANRLYQECLEAATLGGDTYWISRARDGMAWVLIDVGHYSSGEFEQAGFIFEETLEYHRQASRKANEAMGMYGLSRAAAGMGQYDRAIELAEGSIELLKQNGLKGLLQLPLLQIANVHRDRGNFSLSRPYYELAVNAADRSQDSYLQVLTGYHYGCLLHVVGEVEAAQQLWRRSLPAIAELDYPRVGSETCGRLARVAADQGDFEEAYRLQMDSQKYGNRVGVISKVLQNQQLLLRATLDRAEQLEDELTYLTAGVGASEDGIFVLGPP